MATERSRQGSQEWARLIAPGGLAGGPWTQLRPAAGARADQRRRGPEADRLIGSAPGGASVWDGFIPDPVYPTQADPAGS